MLIASAPPLEGPRSVMSSFRWNSPSQCLRRVHVLVVTLALSSIALPLRAQDVPRGFKPFRHADHVPPEWAESRAGPPAETWRDCQGCHRFDLARAERASFLHEVCIRCHVHNTRPIRSIAPPPGREPALFEHADHLRLACRKCHWTGPDGEPGGIVAGRRVAPDHFEVPTGTMGYCFDCHDPSSERETAEKPSPEQHGRFIAALNGRLAARVSNDPLPRRFSHRDHLTDVELASRDASKCTACHVELESSDARNLAEKQFSVASCGRCHTAEFAVETYKKPSVSAATFLHRYHLRPQALERDKELAGERCYRCHELVAPTATTPDHFGVKAFLRAKTGSGVGPKSCTSCHYHESWGVADHGQVAKCAGCHDVSEEFSDVAKLATNRPLVEVKRPAVSGFAGTGQAHPFITRPSGGGGTPPKDAAIEKECAKCHLELAEVASRVREREFSHVTHLPDTPSPANCETCHTEVKLASTPADIKAHILESGAALSYDPKACDRCHRGRELAPRLGTAETRKVHLFSHFDHLKRNPPGKDRPADCLDCHTVEKKAVDEGPRGAADAVRLLVENTLPPKIADCTQCHNHDELAPYTGGVTRADLQKCQVCHTIGVPPNDQLVPVERLRLASMRGPQVHRADSRCRDCHILRDGDAPGRQPFRGPTIVARETKLPHHAPLSRSVVGDDWIPCIECSADSADPKSDPHAGDWRFTSSTHCVDCHWVGLKQSWDLTKEPYNTRLPETIRERFGNERKGEKHPFPGLPPRVPRSG